MKIIHVITGTSVGGAEMMLSKLIRDHAVKGVDSVVVSLSGVGEVGQRMIDDGIPVHDLDINPNRPNPLRLFRYMSLLRHSDPDLVQTWMYHADLLGGVGARLAGRAPVVWNIRHSNLDPDHIKSRTRRLAKISSWLSKSVPARIACCSHTAAAIHGEFGYDRRKMEVIPNGFDLDKFSPSASAKVSLIEEFGLPDDAVLIGHVARFHPQKDHFGLLEAARIVCDQCPNVHFLLCGRDVDSGNEDLVSRIRNLGLEGRCSLVGQRTDVDRLNQAFDIAVSASSSGEGFPNVLGEAMACGTPCAATDVGDSAILIADTGEIVSPGNPHELAAACRRLVELGTQRRAQLGELARQRIAREYSIDAIGNLYLELYKSLVSME